MQKTKSPRVLIPLADGFDEIEAFTLIGTLKRARLDVRVIGLPGVILTGSDGTKIITDGRFDDIDPSSFDALVLVGGEAHEKLAHSEHLIQVLKHFNEESKVIAAIGEAPLILAGADLLEGRKATILPGLERKLSRPRGEEIIVDGNIITAQSPKCAMEFSLKVVESVVSPERANYVKEVLSSGGKGI